MSDTPWRSIAARKREEQRSRIPSQWLLDRAVTDSTDHSVLQIPHRCGLLSKRELHITEQYDATSLVQQLAHGRFTSEEVVRAFCKRAAIAHQLTNCLTEILFDDGLARAQHLDEHLARTGKPIGPLHGLPISLKDTFKIRGYDASIGIAGLCFQPAATHSTLVELLLSLGAVLYCKTNVPQTLSALDSHNNVFGRTRNPTNVQLTAGGSSGGEGALLALRGSPLGVGTDVGGSIRIPAACNGVYGVKPSHGRVPFAGQEGGGNTPGGSRLAIEATAGPIASSVRDCEMFLRVLADAAPAAGTRDPDVLPQTWAQQSPLPQLQLLVDSPAAAPTTTTRAPLRVGVIRTDGHVRPLPSVERFMHDVARTLRSSAHPAHPPIEIVELDVAPILSRVVKTFNGCMSVDGANAWFDLLERTGEPLSPWLQTRLRRRPAKSTAEVREIQDQKLALQTDFLSVWREAGGCWLDKTGSGDREIDVLICPVAPHPTPPIDRWNTVNYTGAFNLLDLPAGVIPVRAFGPSDLETGEVPGSKPSNGWDKINRELWTAGERSVYLDGPMSVQVIGPRLAERRLLEAMAVIDHALGALRDDSTKSMVGKL